MDRRIRSSRPWLARGCSVLAFALAATAAAQTGALPVPRDQTVVVDTDTTHTVLDGANLRVPGGSQWGSGYHQVANEWNWYFNYATGEQILWRITGWEYSDDHTVLTLHVRDGVTWNDGHPFTAHDIVHHVEMLRAHPELIGHGTARDQVSAISAADDLTVEITLSAPNPRFHNHFRMWGGPLGEITAKHVWEDVDPTTFRNWPPTETGPYVLHSVHQDLGMFVWEQRDDYWGWDLLGGQSGPRYVVYRMAPPADINLFEVVQGEVDAPLPHLFPWHLVQAAQALSEYVVIAPFTDPNPIGIHAFNVRNELLAHREARWAMAMLLDRERLAEFYPAAESSTPAPYPWPAPDWGVMDRFVPMAERVMERIERDHGLTFTYDPVRAGQLLDELGYVLDGRWRVTPSGERLRLAILSRSATSMEEFYVAEHLAEQLREIGVDATIRTVDPGGVSQALRDGDYDIFTGWIEGWAAWTGDLFTGMDNWRWEREDVIREWMLPESAERDAALDALARALPDDPAAEPLYEEALYHFMLDMMQVPAAQKVFVQVFSNRYWTGWPTEADMWHVPYQWWPEFKFVLFGLTPAQVQVQGP
jgi:peptide/nickel transport system substrate-binding protein